MEPLRGRGLPGTEPERRGPTTVALTIPLIAFCLQGLVKFAVGFLVPYQTPVVAGRVTATLAILPAVRRGHRLPLPTGLGAAACGIAATLALVCYLLATRRRRWCGLRPEPPK